MSGVLNHKTFFLGYSIVCVMAFNYSGNVKKSYSIMRERKYEEFICLKIIITYSGK
jgi:hypothetical protein